MSEYEFKVGDTVETINGMAEITYIRKQGGELVFETTAGVFFEGEIQHA